MGLSPIPEPPSGTLRLKGFRGDTHAGLSQEGLGSPLLIAITCLMRRKSEKSGGERYHRNSESTVRACEHAALAPERDGWVEGWMDGRMDRQMDVL